MPDHLKKTQSKGVRVIVIERRMTVAEKAFAEGVSIMTRKVALEIDSRLMREYMDAGNREIELSPETPSYALKIHEDL